MRPPSSRQLARLAAATALSTPGSAWASGHAAEGIGQLLLIAAVVVLVPVLVVIVLLGRALFRWLKGHPRRQRALALAVAMTTVAIAVGVTVQRLTRPAPLSLVSADASQVRLLVATPDALYVVQDTGAVRIDAARPGVVERLAWPSGLTMGDVNAAAWLGDTLAMLPLGDSAPLLLLETGKRQVRPLALDLGHAGTPRLAGLHASGDHFVVLAQDGARNLLVEFTPAGTRRTLAFRLPDQVGFLADVLWLDEQPWFVVTNRLDWSEQLISVDGVARPARGRSCSASAFRRGVGTDAFLDHHGQSHQASFPLGFVRQPDGELLPAPTTALGDGPLAHPFAGPPPWQLPSSDAASQEWLFPVGARYVYFASFLAAPPRFLVTDGAGRRLDRSR